MRSTFKVIFYLKKRMLQAGETASAIKFPIMCRVTINGEAKTISTKLSVNPSLWDTSGNRAKGKSEDSQQINRVLNNINTKITKIYQDLCVTEAVVTSQKVKAAYEGFGGKHKTLMQAYGEFIEDFSKRIGKDRQPKTLKSFYDRIRVLKNYMRDKLDISDITFPELTSDFMTDFISYMRDDMHYSTSYMYGAVRTLRKLVHIAKESGVIRQDPFRGYYINRKYKERTPLWEEDIQKLIAVDLKDKRTKAQRDVHLFMVFTGLSFCDIQKLKYDRLFTTEDGDLWIIDKRKKNDASFKVKLVPLAKELVERYRDYPKKKNPDMVFPVTTYIGHYEAMVKIAKKAGVNNRVTPHGARHTFATTVTLEQGVPIETVSRMLGHRKLTTTQVYAKVLKNKIGNDMDAITDKLQAKYKLPEREDEKRKAV